MHDNCTVCQQRNFNILGLQTAEQEVIPFIKTEVLKLRYSKHPLPFKYKGLLESLFAYSQALTFNRAHNIQGVYYTENSLLIKYSSALNDKFGMPVYHKSQLTVKPKLVCEFTTEVEQNEI